MRVRRLWIILPFLLIYLIFPNATVQFVSLTIILVLLFSFLYSFTLFKRVLINRNKEPIRAFKNSKIDIEVDIVNDSLLPAFNLFAEDHFSHLTLINGKSKIKVDYRTWSISNIKYCISGNLRGEYKLGPVEIKGSDPFGIFPWKKIDSNYQDLIIYPGITRVDSVLTDGLPGGTIKSINPADEDLTQFRSLREYIAGDDPRRINWKVSARLGELFTMQYLPSIYYSAIVLLNLNENEYPIKYRFNKIEKAIEVASSLIYYHTNEKQAVGLHLHGVIDGNELEISAPTAKSESHAVKLLEVLAKVSPSKSNNDPLSSMLNSSKKIPRGSRLLYVGPPLLSSQLHSLQELRKKGIFPELYYISQQKEQDRFSYTKLKIHYLEDKAGELLQTR